MTKGVTATPASAELSSPELRLLLAALGKAILDDQPGDGGPAPAGGARWIALVTLAMRHQVGGVALTGLQRMPGLGVPPPLLAQLRQHAAEILREQESGIAELRRLARALAEAGVETIPIKGPALRRRLLPGMAAGPSRDLDVLIRHESAERAFAALRHCGYPRDPTLSPRQSEKLLRLHGQDLLFREDGRFALEPHIAIAPSTLGLAVDHDGLWARSREAKLDDAPVRVLEAEDEFLLLAVHGSKEGWSKLKWLADLAAFVAREPALDWDTVSARARQQRVRRMVALAALVLAEGFSIELPLLAPARRERQLAALARTIVSRWDRPDAAPLFASSIFDLSWKRSICCDGLAARVSYFWRSVVSPRERHYRLVRLPDWMCPAYVPVKIVHDYMLLPAWMLAPRSVRSRWSRSRRSTGPAPRAAGRDSWATVPDR